mgnify:CR=1 FL=1
MRTYCYAQQYQKLLTPDIVSLLTQIHEYKGEQALFIESQADTLTQLVEIAKIQSTAASNRIEGIYTSDERLKKLVQDKTMPHTRNEQEIAGYRDVLATIHENFDYIPPKPSMILQLHRDLYKFSGMSYGGRYKTGNNVISEVDTAGNKHVRFQPVPAWETPRAMEELCRAYEEAIAAGEIDPLLLIPMFVLDFLCIPPFNDGNGRMSRLLTLLLLYRAGYIVGKYISIEKLIEQSKETYYEALQQSSLGWHEEQSDYLPFVRYMLGVVAAAYREFSGRVQVLTVRTMSKPERIRETIKKHLGKITKAELMAQCPDISLATVQRTLAELQKNGEIIKLGGGRYTAYTWNRERE